MSEGFRPPKYTMVPDSVFDELLPDLSESELKVLLYIIRRTFGFLKTSDQISLSQMSGGIIRADGEVMDRGTGMATSTCSRAAKKLAERGLILITPQSGDDGGTDANLYTLRFESIAQESRGAIAHGSTPPLLRDQTQYTDYQYTETKGAGAPEPTLYEIRDSFLSMLGESNNVGAIVVGYATKVFGDGAKDYGRAGREIGLVREAANCSYREAAEQIINHLTAAGEMSPAPSNVWDYVHGICRKRIDGFGTPGTGGLYVDPVTGDVRY